MEKHGGCLQPRLKEINHKERKEHKEKNSAKTFYSLCYLRFLWFDIKSFHRRIINLHTLTMMFRNSRGMEPGGFSIGIY